MAESLETGLMLMATGMGTVFVLLAVLVYLVRGVSRLAVWIAGPAATVAPPAASSVQAGAAPSAEAELVAIIGAAVAAFKRGEQRS